MALALILVPALAVIALSIQVQHWTAAVDKLLLCRRCC